MTLASFVGQQFPSLSGRIDEYKFGFNPDIDTVTTPEDVWDRGGVYPWPTSASPVTIVSTDAADSVSGSGVREIRVVGLDINFNVVSQDINLSGLSPVVLPLPLYRINRMYGLRAGATGWNVGDITATITGTVRSQISATRGQTLQAVYTVPSLPSIQSVYFRSWSITAGRTVSTLVRALLYTRSTNTLCWRTRDIKEVVSQGSSYIFAPVNQGGFRLEPGDDIRVTVTACSANDVPVSASFAVEFIPT